MLAFFYAPEGAEFQHRVRAERHRVARASRDLRGIARAVLEVQEGRSLDTIGSPL
jgi:hypothetical protein